MTAERHILSGIKGFVVRSGDCFNGLGVTLMFKLMLRFCAVKQKLT